MEKIKQKKKMIMSFLNDLEQEQSIQICGDIDQIKAAEKDANHIYKHLKLKKDIYLIIRLADSEKKPINKLADICDKLDYFEFKELEEDIALGNARNFVSGYNKRNDTKIKVKKSFDGRPILYKSIMDLDTSKTAPAFRDLAVNLEKLIVELSGLDPELNFDTYEERESQPGQEEIPSKIYDEDLIDKQIADLSAKELIRHGGLQDEQLKDLAAYTEEFKENHPIYKQLFVLGNGEFSRKKFRTYISELYGIYATTVSEFGFNRVVLDEDASDLKLDLNVVIEGDEEE